MKIQILNIEKSKEETLEIYFNSLIMEIREKTWLNKFKMKLNVLEILVSIGIFWGEQRSVGFLYVSLCV